MGLKKIKFNAYEKDKLCQWLLEKRLEKNLSRRKVAERIGVITSWVQRIEEGTRRLEIFECIGYCKALKVDPIELINYLIEIRNFVNENSPQYNSKSKK